jgi:hypothetical protein
VLLRCACGGGRWTQETHLARACRTGRDVRGERCAHSHPCAPAAAEAWKRLQGYVGGTNAALPDATQPIAAMHAGPPGPTFAGRAQQSERLPIDTGKEPFARTGGTSEPSHSELCICALVGCCRPCLLLCISICLPAFICCSVSAAHRSSSPSSTRRISPANRLF